MSAVPFSRNHSVSAAAAAETEFRCSVVVLYESPIAHEKAMEICERLRREAGEDAKFDFACWDFKDLVRPAEVTQSLDAACEADILLFASHGGNLPLDVRRWIAACEERRTKPDGAISVVFVKPISRASCIGSVLAQLQTSARRMDMDFLPMLPKQTRHAIEVLEQRERMATVVSELLLEPHSTHYGLDD